MKIQRVILSILAMLPFKAVAFAADSRLTTLAGEEANSFENWESMLADKSKLFEDFQVVTSTEDAFERFKKSTNSSEQDAQVEFRALVEKMLKNGTITVNEKSFISGIPSEH